LIAPRRQPTVFVEGTRLIVVVLATAAGFWLSRDLGAGSEGLFGMLGCLFGYVGGGLLGRLLDRAVGVVEHRVERLPPAQVVAGTLGALGGALAGAALAAPLLVVVPVRLGLAVGALIVWIAAFVGFRVIGGRSAAMLELLGLSTRPLVRASAFDARDGLLVDTSVLMDGQLLALARTGLLGGDLLVARFVLDELQGFADGPRDTRARRARQGLEALDALRREGPLRVYVLDDEVPELGAVDAKLAALARRLELRLLTNDAALARNAEIQGVPTINLRRLASDLAPSIVPGDFVRVSLTRPGRQADQGVGHLDDGSMVVVNGGAGLVGGPELSLRVTSVVPTAVGRVVFASMDDADTVATAQ
jgi:uncharacterized protein YacL